MHGATQGAGVVGTGVGAAVVVVVVVAFVPLVVGPGVATGAVVGAAVLAFTVAAHNAATFTLYGMSDSMAASSSRVVAALNVSKMLSLLFSPRTTARPISDKMKNNPTVQHVMSQHRFVSGWSGIGAPQQYGSTCCPGNC